MITETQLLDQLIGKRGLLPTLHWTYTHFRAARVVDSNKPEGFTWRTPLQGIAGYPDITAVRDKRILWAELKGPGGKLTVEQTVWLDLLDQAGGEVYLWTPSDWEELVEILTRGHEPSRLEALSLKSAWSNRGGK